MVERHGASSGSFEPEFPFHAQGFPHDGGKPGALPGGPPTALTEPQPMNVLPANTRPECPPPGTAGVGTAIRADARERLRNRVQGWPAHRSPVRLDTRAAAGGDCAG